MSTAVTLIDTPRKLTDFGITRNQSSRFQKLAAIAQPPAYRLVQNFSRCV